MLHGLCIPTPLMRTTAMRRVIGFLLVFAALQVAFWSYSHRIRPAMEIVPEVPSARTLQALTFGDSESFFRLHALGLQNAGDTFGRFTALYKYDFRKLTQWFTLLDGLNNHSNYIPAMATYYYSQTQNIGDVGYIVDYLDQYSRDRVPEKWWWVVQATYLAQHKMGDLARAQQLADRLVGVRTIPIWAQQMPAFIHEQRGEFDDALRIIEGVMQHPEDYNDGELNFMRYFVDERLGRLNKVETELNAIRAYKAELKAQGIPEPQTKGPPSDVGAARLPN